MRASPLDDEAYARRSNEAEARLRPLLTDEFLGTLVLAVRVIGWGVDWCESESFARECFALAGKEVPELTALDFNVEGLDDGR